MNADNNLKKDFFSILVFTIFWFGLFIYTGSLTSGYHFIDDHQIITLDRQLKTAPVHSVSKKLIVYDGRFRFRPVFNIHRVLATKILGLNFTLWSFYTGLLGILTSFFLYKFLALQDYSFLQSVMFSILTLTGVQSVIWYQYADAENLGMLFLSLSLYFLVKSINSEKHSALFKILLIISLLFSSLSKESFILMIPAVLFLYLILYGQKNSCSLYKSFRENIFLTGIPFAVMSAALIYLIIYVGLNRTGQTGIDNKIFSIMFIREFVYSLRSSVFFLSILFGMFIVSDSLLTFNTGIFTKESLIKIKNHFLNYSVLFFLIIIPQYVLYYKSGMRDRYLLPFFLGFSFFIIYLLKEIFQSKQISSFVKYLFLFLVAALTFFQIKNDTVPYLKIYADDSKATNRLLGSVIANTNRESVLTAVIDPVQNFEQGKSFMIYMRNFADKKNINFKMTKREYVTDSFSDTNFYNLSERSARIFFKRELFDSLKSTESVECVVIFPKLEKVFLEENKSWFNPDNFRKESFDQYNVYYKK